MAAVFTRWCHRDESFARDDPMTEMKGLGCLSYHVAVLNIWDTTRMSQGSLVFGSLWCMAQTPRLLSRVLACSYMIICAATLCFLNTGVLPCKRALACETCLTAPRATFAALLHASV